MPDQTVTRTRRPPQRRRDPRVPLEDLLDAAIGLLDRDGLGGLTMRRLADEAGIGVMTLYGYVRTKEELLGALGGRALSRVSVPNDPAGDWSEQLREAIRNLHDALQEHPGLVDLLIGQVVTGPTLNHIRNGLLGILIRAGFPADEAVEAFGALVNFAFGFAVAERTRHHPEYGTHDRATDGQDFPYLTATAEVYPSRVSNSAFEYGLELLIDELNRRHDGSPM
jgi:AcrR family transcriptional regulator